MSICNRRIGGNGTLQSVTQCIGIESLRFTMKATSRNEQEQVRMRKLLDTQKQLAILQVAEASNSLAHL